MNEAVKAGIANIKGGERKFKCEVCGVSCISKGSLENHMERFHSGENNEKHSLEASVLKELKKFPSNTGCRIQILPKLVHGNYKYVCKVLSDLVLKGRVKRIGRGIYAATEDIEINSNETIEDVLDTASDFKETSKTSPTPEPIQMSQDEQLLDMKVIDFIKLKLSVDKVTRMLQGNEEK